MEFRKPADPLDNKLFPEQQKPLTWREKIQTLAKKRLVAMSITFACINCGLTGFSTLQVWNTSQDLQKTVRKSTQLRSLSKDVIYLDEY
jgi:hypothetical protein